MKFPWSKTRQPVEPIAAVDPWPKPSEPPVDVAAIARDAAEQATTRVAEEFARALVANSPMQGVPNPNAPAPLPLYAFDNPLTFSTPQPPTRPPEALVDTRTLRKLADTYDVLRSCINHLKREVAAVPLEVVFKEESRTKNFRPSPAQQKRLDEAKTFLLSTKGGLGGHGRRPGHFWSEVFEDVCVIGAAAIYHAPTRAGGVYESIAIDSATIRPWVDAYGWADDGKAYEQWVQGVLIRSFSRDELTYDGVWPVSHSPYFKSPVEYLLNVINAALRADAWNLAWLTDGDSANEVFAMPDGYSIEKIQAMYALWDAQNSGNSRNRVKTKFLPAGSQKVGNSTRKDQDFQEFELWLLRRTCSIMGVSPASIGYAGEQYKVSQDASHDQTTQFGAGVLLDYRKAQADDILERAGYDDLETRNVTGQEEDKKSRAARNEIELRSGQKTINEVRTENGDDAIDGGDVTLVSNTLLPLDLLGEEPAGEANAGTVADEPSDPAAGANPAAGDKNKPDDNEGSQTAPNRAQTGYTTALRQWETKALKRLKQKGSAGVAFESAVIPREISARLLGALPQCHDTESVRSLFRTVTEESN